jgi:hypothetical protein
MGVTVGTGGVRGQNGQNSVFDGLTAIGGGRGGVGSTPGASGGSGGGSQFGAAGAGTTGQGFGGGSNAGVGSTVGGGGGAGGAGQNGYYYEYDGYAYNEASGAGGPGLSVSITGSPVVYAAGGDVSIYAAALSQNTGGGGGGSTGLAGRNGVVIIAYQGPPLAYISDGLTYTHSTSSRPGWNVYRFTGGTGTISDTAPPALTASGWTGNGTSASKLTPPSTPSQWQNTQNVSVVVGGTLTLVANAVDYAQDNNAVTVFVNNSYWISIDPANGSVQTFTRSVSAGNTVSLRTAGNPNAYWLAAATRLWVS